MMLVQAKKDHLTSICASVIKTMYPIHLYSQYFRQNKLDEALMSSGRISDAVQSLMEWLQKAEAYLSEEQPILGDLDTVHILSEQHKVGIQSFY